MVSRREWLGLTLGAGAALTLDPRLLRALQQGQLLTRAIPSSGEKVPVVGLGSSATFGRVAGSDDVTGLKEVLKAMVEKGATVFDTAPGYGASERVAGEIAAELGLTNKIFWATKVNTASGGQPTTREAALAQIDRSHEFFKIPAAKAAGPGSPDPKKMDLIQVHNLADLPTQLGLLKELKQQGRIRYIGVTTTSDNAYTRLEEVMRNEPIDFIGVDYAVDNRGVEQTILPLAQERKIGVMVYVPFGRTRLFQRVGDRPLPDWAKDFDATTWAQFFIKYVVSHPAVTVVTPATSQARHMIDNIGGGIGRLPNEATRKKMVDFIDALPPAPAGRGRGGGAG